MKYNYKKILISLLLIIPIILCLNLNTFAHSGRTDSSGGHKDNKNKSGLGSYHYHCGGHPAHLHTNGVCPYSSNSSSKSSSSTSSSSSSKSSSSKSVSTSSKTSTSSSNKAVYTTPTTVNVTEIQINKNIDSMKVGENKKLTATITPSNATDKNITWKTSDESIAIVSSTGEVTAKKSGVVNITASTSNGKTNTVKINVKEETKEEKNTTANISISNRTNTNSNVERTNPIGGILALGLLGGGGYWGYKKIKK